MMLLTQYVDFEWMWTKLAPKACCVGGAVILARTVCVTACLTSTTKLRANSVCADSFARGNACAHTWLTRTERVDGGA